MAKRKQPRFTLSLSSNKQLDKYLSEIRKGIENVCEMHKHDSKPSMTQYEFEKLYIDMILGQPITAISASLRTMSEGLAKQKETEIQAKDSYLDNKENKQ